MQIYCLKETWEQFDIEIRKFSTLEMCLKMSCAKGGQVPLGLILC